MHRTSSSPVGGDERRERLDASVVAFRSLGGDRLVVVSVQRQQVPTALVLDPVAVVGPRRRLEWIASLVDVDVVCAVGEERIFDAGPQPERLWRNVVRFGVLVVRVAEARPVVGDVSAIRPAGTLDDVVGVVGIAFAPRDQTRLVVAAEHRRSKLLTLLIVHTLPC